MNTTNMNITIEQINNDEINEKLNKCISIAKNINNSLTNIKNKKH